MSEAVAEVNSFVFGVLGLEVFYACNAVTNEASRRVKQKTGAELVGYVELAHHNGQTLAERWRVTREQWLRRNR
jgi:[ribosomal protein S5]-alanine N-acetyltransferase